MSVAYPIFDLHCHAGPHGASEVERPWAESLIRNMDRADVKFALLSHTSAIWTPSRRNADTVAVVQAFPGRCRGLTVTYPQYPELTAEILREHEARPEIFGGFKLHPLYHKHPLSGTGYEEVLEYANAHSRIVLVHTWGNGHVIDETERTRMILSFCGPEQARRVLERYPNIKLLAGHSFNGHWDQAAQLAVDFPNLYLETSTVNDRGVIEMFCERAGSEKVVFGSDFPFMSPRYNVACVVTADITDTDRRNILSDNAKRILSASLPDRALSRTIAENGVS